METNLIYPENPLFTNTINIEPVKEKKPLDKKILLFGSLFVISISLLILSTIVSQNKNQSTTPTVTPTLTPQTTSSVTSPQSMVIPTQYQLPLNQIDTEIKTQLEFAPPEIDQDIGL